MVQVPDKIVTFNSCLFSSQPLDAFWIVLFYLADVVIWVGHALGKLTHDREKFVHVRKSLILHLLATFLEINLLALSFLFFGDYDKPCVNNIGVYGSPNDTTRIARYAAIAIGLAIHTPTSFVLVPNVYGVRGYTQAAYVFSILAHVAAMIRALTDIDNFSWTLQLFYLLHMYPWVRAFMLLLARFHLVYDLLYTLSVTLAITCLLPIAFPSRGVCILALLAIISIDSIAFFIKTRGAHIISPLKPAEFDREDFDEEIFLYTNSRIPDTAWDNVTCGGYRDLGEHPEHKASEALHKPSAAPAPSSPVSEKKEVQVSFAPEPVASSPNAPSAASPSSEPAASAPAANA